MTFLSLTLAFIAGLLSVLAPCVLPLLPIVIASAANESRAGPLALATGLALSFTAIGLFVATIGFSVGFDGDWFRKFGGVLLLGFAAILLVPSLQARLAAAAGPASNWVDRTFGGFAAAGLGGQFALGALLGAVWAPCVGPTLGAASVLAAQGNNLTDVALTMLTFGIGAAVPLVLLGMLSREALSRHRTRIAGTGQRGKTILGAILAAVGLLTLTGLDKSIETFLVQASPAWLTELTTRF